MDTNISPNTTQLSLNYNNLPADGWIHPCYICNIPTFQINSNKIYQCYNCQKIIPKQTYLKRSYCCILSVILIIYIIKIYKK